MRCSVLWIFGQAVHSTLLRQLGPLSGRHPRRTAGTQVRELLMRVVTRSNSLPRCREMRAGWAGSKRNPVPSVTQARIGLEKNGSTKRGDSEGATANHRPHGRAGRGRHRGRWRCPDLVPDGRDWTTSRAAARWHGGWRDLASPCASRRITRHGWIGWWQCVPRAGHVPFFDQPAEFSAVLIQFLRGD